MRYTRIDVAGGNDLRASIRRERGAEFVEVEITGEGEARTHQVRADDEGDLWSMAECLQERLDGFTGAGGDVRAYFHPLSLIGDA